MNTFPSLRFVSAVAFVAAAALLALLLVHAGGPVSPIHGPGR